MMERIRNLFFPPKCAACGALLEFTDLQPHDTLCKDCLSAFRNEQKELCMFCHREVRACTCMPELLTKAGAKYLLKTVYYCHGKRTAVQNRMIFRIKNQRDLRTARFLARELASTLLLQARDGALSTENAVIVYIPRSRRALLESGTDQARALARALSQKTGICVLSCLVRNRDAKREQKTLSPKERMRNARTSFTLRNGELLRGRTVLIVDDIVTTGASMAAATKKLLRAGAGDVICIAASSDDANKAPLAPQPVKHEKSGAKS